MVWDMICGGCLSVIEIREGEVEENVDRWGEGGNGWKGGKIE